MAEKYYLYFLGGFEVYKNHPICRVIDLVLPHLDLLHSNVPLKDLWLSFFSNIGFWGLFKKSSRIFRPDFSPYPHSMLRYYILKSKIRNFKFFWKLFYFLQHIGALKFVKYSFK